MKADQLAEFDKKDFQDNEAHNLHTENAVEIAKAFGTPEEIEAMERIQDAHMRRGHILPNEIEERNALVSKYYSMLESSVNPTFRSTLEGYKVLPPMDKEKYQARDGLEGPFSTLSGKVVYYDPKAGKYYDPDTDMYLSYDDFQKLDNDYSDMKEADDFEPHMMYDPETGEGKMAHTEADHLKMKDMGWTHDDPKTKKVEEGPRGHLRSIVADDLNEIDCWDGYRKDGTKPGTGKNKGKRVNNCVKIGEEDVTVDNEGNIAGYLNTIDEYVEMLFKSAKDKKDTEIAYRIQNAVDDIRMRELGLKPSNIRSQYNEGEVNEEHDIGLLKAVARQMEMDAHKGDYTAIEELLQNISTEELKAFLSDHRDMDEGKSPHKKGTEKYKKHMAAMHAG